MIRREPHTESPKKPAQTFGRPRVAPLWSDKGRKKGLALEALTGGTRGGRFFDENGQWRGGGRFDGDQGLFSMSDSLSSIFRVSLPIGDREESDRPYEENVWVRAGIKAIKSGFLRLGFCLYSGDPKEESSEKIDAHPLLDLLASPNQLMTERKFWEAHVVDMKLDGEQVWFLVNSQGEPVKSDPKTRRLLEMPASIIPVRGKYVQITPDSMGMPKEYRYQFHSAGSKGVIDKVFSPGSVVHFRDYDPDNMTRGLGDGDALVRETDLYFQAFRSMDGAVRNGGDTGGFITYEQKIGPAEMDRRQAEADEQLSGPNAPRYKVLESGGKFVPNGIKPSDMQYREMVEWLRDSILAGIGVPPPVVGIFDDATYNNVETAYRELFTGPNGVLALAEITGDVIQNDLLPRMDGLAESRRSARGGTFVYFDSSGIEALSDDVGSKIDRALALSTGGTGISFNEGMAMQGAQVELPDAGERRFIAGGLDEDGIEDETGEPSDDAAADPTSVLNGAQIASLLSIIDQVSTGALPLDTAIQIIVASFPFDEARAKRILRDVEPGSQEPEPTAAPGEEGSDEDSDEDAAEEDGDDESESEESARAVSGELFTDGIEPSPKLQRRLETYLSAYERETLSRIRRISNNGLRALSPLDDPIDPEGLTEEQWEALLLDKAVWTARLERDVRVALREVFTAALLEAHGEVGGGLVSNTEPRVIEALTTQRMRLAEGVTSITSDRVRNAIARVMAGATPGSDLRSAVQEALPELTEELRKSFGTKEARAATIAQTETGIAENGARFMQYGESGVKKIRWVSSLDEAVRSSHEGVHGEIVEMGMAFSNGLRHPHDPEAPAREVINCRCTYRAEEFVNPLDALEAELDNQ